jgi:hypothetical protein
MGPFLAVFQAERMSPVWNRVPPTRTVRFNVGRKENRLIWSQPFNPWPEIDTVCFNVGRKEDRLIWSQPFNPWPEIDTENPP